MKKLLLLLTVVLFVSCSSNKQERENFLKTQMIESYKSGEWQLALSYIDTLRSSGVDLDILPIEAECYAGIGEYDKAIAMLEKEIELDTMSDIHYIYQTLGNIYHYKKDYDKSIINYKKTIELNPFYVRPYVNLAEIFELTGDKQQSVDYYLAAIRLFAEHNFIDETIEYSNKVLTIDPENIEAYKYLQYGLHSSKQYNDAVSVGLRLDNILEEKELFDERCENWLFTGMAAFDCKDYPLSYFCISNAMQSEGVKETYGYLGYSYLSALSRKQGDLELAKEYSNIAKSYGKDPEDQKKFLYHLIQMIKI